MSCLQFLATIFVLVNLIGQLGGCGLVITRFKVDIACGVLFFIVCLQTVAYSILWDFHFLLRNFALIGALLLVLAESRVEGRSLFAGVPSLGENKPKNILQLAGRILLAFMFITLLRFELSVLQVIQDIFGSILMVLVTIGYKTKLSALALVLMLTMLNLYYNAWWSIPAHKPLRDFLKYDFFQVGRTMAAVNVEGVAQFSMIFRIFAGQLAPRTCPFPRMLTHTLSIRRHCRLSVDY